MSGVYSVEDLLKLRASPLICKPPNLPPIEEWMGSQEPMTKRPATRGRQEDHHLQTEGFQKRPTLDPSLRKSTTDPERIVLGPPRRSFASSNARTFGKAGAADLDETQKEGTGRHERNKTGEDLEAKFADRRSGQFGGINGRYSHRHEQDHDKPRRRHEDEDPEGRPKREHDRSKWGKEDKANEETDENGNIRLGFKRELQARSRFEQSWLRTDRGTEEARRDSERSGWRRDRVKDGDWDLSGKGDGDPEWMDTIDGGEPAQAHTQEDFQRWKERMKAAANGPMEEKHEPPATIIASPDTGSKQSQGVSLSGLVSPDLNVNSMDKFFAKFNEKRAPPDEKAPATKPATKSKFASLFSPPAETKPEAPALPVIPGPSSIPVMPVIPGLSSIPTIAASPVAPPAPIAKSPLPTADQMHPAFDADQAGFKRILEMLGKRDTTPSGESPKSKPAPDQQTHERHQSPDLMALFKQTQPTRQTPVSQGPPGLDRLIESRSPAEGHRRQETPNKDELLLNLLRQADISAKPAQQPHREYNEQRVPPGLFASMNEPNRHESRQMHEERQEMDRQAPTQQRGNGRSMFDDPAISGYSYQDEMGNRQGTQRRLTNGFEDQYFERLRQQEQKPMQPPPGMPRPPGLGEMSRMPPGWPGQALPRHEQQRQGPPGINMPRGMQPSFGGPQQGPMPPMPQQGQRPPQRKYTGESSLPNFPPGIAPPPGFMNNPPPPGFHMNNAGNQPQNYQRYAMGGENQGPHQQGPPNMNRAFMEMYGNVDRNGIRGGNGGVPLPPGFR